MAERTPARGFTLVELLASIVVLAIIGAVVLPLVATATSRYRIATDQRAAVERVAYALDRVVRLIREAPAGPGGTLDLASASADALRFGDGRGIEMASGDLVLRLPDGTTGVLCPDVDVVELRYIAADGVTDVGATDPARAWRVEVRLGAAGVELIAAAFPRVRTMGG